MKSWTSRGTCFQRSRESNRNLSETADVEAKPSKKQAVTVYGVAWGGWGGPPPGPWKRRQLRGSSTFRLCGTLFSLLSALFSLLSSLFSSQGPFRPHVRGLPKNIANPCRGSSNQMFCFVFCQWHAPQTEKSKPKASTGIPKTPNTSPQSDPGAPKRDPRAPKERPQSVPIGPSGLQEASGRAFGRLRTSLWSF